MSAIIGLSDKEIDAIDLAARNMRAVTRLTGNSEHEQTTLVLEGILQRISRTWGGTPAETRPVEYLTELLQAVMPKEESE